MGYNKFGDGEKNDVNLNDIETAGWLAARCWCKHCGYEYGSVFPYECERHECPRCGKFTPDSEAIIEYWSPNDAEDDES